MIKIANKAKTLFKKIMLLRKTFLCVGLLCYASLSHALPPPDALVLLGGGILYPILLVLGLLVFVFKYIWIKTKLYVCWRRYPSPILTVLVLFILTANFPLYSLFLNLNQPTSLQIVKEWQQANKDPLLIDIRSPTGYEKIHLQGALNFPSGYGLVDYLKKHPQSNVILYCDYGVKSADFRWLAVDKDFTTHLLAEHRIFYIPGGLHSILNMGHENPIPLVINFNHEKGSTAGSIDKSVLIIAMLSMGLFAIRRREFLKSFLKESAFYQWVGIILSASVTLILVQLNVFNLAIPFDVYLYSLNLDLPMNAGYLIAVYAFFMVNFTLTILFPIRHRLVFLRQRIRAIYAPGEPLYFRPLASIWKGLVLSSVSLLLFFVWGVSLSTTCLVSLFLMIPLLIDLVLYGFFAFSLSKDQVPSFSFLRACGFFCAPNATACFELDTKAAQNLGQIALCIENQTILMGLFSDDKSLPASLNDPSFQEAWPRALNQLRDLLRIIPQDLRVGISDRGAIVSLSLYHNPLESRVINRHQLLTHYHLLPDAIDKQRFTSQPFQDSFAYTNPLMLSLLKMRWSKKGGCVKALRKLGLLIKSSDKVMAQTLGLAHRVYLDEALEKDLLQRGKRSFFRQKLAKKTVDLALESLNTDYYMLMLPRMQWHLQRLKNHLTVNYSGRQLKKVVNRALRVLYKESAMWQCYVGLLHQHAFLLLQLHSETMKQEASLLFHPSFELPLTSHYDLCQETAFLSLEQFNQKESSPYHQAFKETEAIRGQLRDMQLQEWQLIGLLLEKWQRALDIPISLTYLCIEDLRYLPRKTSQLRTLLRYRHDHWQQQNNDFFPQLFSLKDMECLCTKPEDIRINEKSQALRVAGDQPKINGTVFLLTDNTVLKELPSHAILVADNIWPEQIVMCQHIRALVLRKGNYLSHSSIIAREKNIPLIAQYPIDSLSEGQRLSIEGARFQPLEQPFFEWDFLDAVFSQASIGHKAQRLGYLIAQHFRLPESIFLSHKTVDAICQSLSCKDASATAFSHKGLSAVFALFEPTQLPLIARSSSTVEDSSTTSYAGLFTSVNAINSVQDLASAIQTIRQHAFAQKALIKDYGGASDFLINIILQPYIQGEFGGILFTQTPKRQYMQIEISRGGVEGITEGETPVSSLYINEKGDFECIQGEDSPLSATQCRALYQLGAELQSRFNKPQDIEWIMDANKHIYIIQSRDIVVPL